MQTFLRWIVIWVVVALVVGCATHERYTSLDLDLLPCEHGNAPQFFIPIEFTESGEPRYPRQMDALDARFREPAPITDIVIFVHGWSKNPSSAESDYQNFLCRLHGKLREVIGDRKRQDGLLVIGIFWPSTITNRASEPMLLKPASYYRIRNRADHISRTGVPQLLQRLAGLVRETQGDMAVRMQFIGHSFGGRIVVGSLKKLKDDGQLVEFLQSVGSVNVVLLNAAVAPDRFRWIPEAIAKSFSEKTPGRFTNQTESYLFNVHSLHDSATKTLFPIASMFNDDPAVCAAGACGIPYFETVMLDDSGSLILDGANGAERCMPERINAWNIDATAVVFGHTDVYKGRIAALLSQLTYDEEIRSKLPHKSDGEAICPPQ